MFKLAPNPTFKAAVTIPIPGQPEGEKVTFIFKHMTKKAFVKFYDRLAGTEARKDSDVVGDLVSGWEGVDAEFSVENLETFLDNYPPAALAIMDTYRVELLEARAKN
jgi:hypothetical protein